MIREQIPQPAAEVLVQISPEQLGVLTSAHEKSKNTFNYIIELFDQLEAEDQTALIEYYEYTNRLADNFKSLFTDISDMESTSVPQSELSKTLKSAEVLSEELETLKKELEANMKKLGYEIVTNFVDKGSSEPKPSPAPVEASAVVEEPVVKPAVTIATPPSQEEGSTKKPHDQHVKDRLVDQLFDNNSHDFLLTDAPDGAKRKKKPIKDLKADIATVFAARGVHGKVAKDFFNTKFKAQHEEISHLVKLSQTETDKAKISEYREAINNAYEQIREDVIAEVMIAQPAYEESLKNQEERQNSLEESSPAQRGIEAIKKDIEDARFYLDELRERHKDNDDFVNSPEYTRVIDIFKLADDCEDSDSNILNQKLEKYLTGLWPALDELTDKFTVGVGTESESKENIDATKPDVDSEKVEPADAATPEAISYPLSVRAPSERDVQREKSLEAKQQFRDVKKQYHEALGAHQNELKNRSMWEKMKSLGMKPEVPEAIKALETEYLARRKDYARELDARLSQRGEKFELSQDDIKRAFARKFIIRPQEDLLKLQEHNFFTSEEKGRVMSILANLAKHKITIRLGTVLLAGVAGAATGGTALAFAGAAGWQVGKIAGSAAVGTLAGGAANTLTQKIVDRTTANLKKTTEGVESNFNIEGMDALAENLTRAKEVNKNAEKYQKVATVVAGGLAGFAAGNGFAENVPDVITDLTRPTGLSEEALGNLETSKIIPKVTETPDVPPQPAFMEKIALPFDSREGGLVYEHHVNDLSLGSEFKPAALSEPQTKELSSFIRLKSDDLLSAHPNISEANFEKQLQAAIEKKFSGASWWSESPVKTVDVGKLEVVLVSGTETAPVAAAAESSPANRLQLSPEQIRGEYVVKSGDTLWEIAEEQFKDQLKHLSPSERNQVLDRLFDRVKEDPFLLESLSLQSGNNIDRIYAGEKIELSGLQAELASELEKREIVEQFRKSAPLSVEADSGVKSVPITVVEKPIPGGTEVVINNERSYTEAVPTKPVITPEITTSTKSFYETAPQHVRDEIRQYFNNPRAFDVAVERAADQVSARAYDFFDTFSNNYESPYNLVREMTVAKFAEYQALPNSQLRSLLTENKIKYEAFLEWQEKIKELKETIPHTKTDTIGSLFEQSVFQDKVTEKANSEMYRN